MASEDNKHPQVKHSKNTIVGVVGDFPTIKAPNTEEFPTGEIVLKYGDHLTQSRGYGYVHILAEHTADLDKHKLPHNIEGVLEYIRMIIKPGAGVYTEFFMSKNKYIPTIFWTKVGIVILQREELPNGTNRYSVITAYGKQSPVGQKIGTIENKKTS